MIHLLLGGSQTQIIKHKYVNIILQDEQDTLGCDFETLDQDIICKNVLSVKIGPWTEELLKLEIKIHEEANMPVEVLKGPAIERKQYADRRHGLRYGLIVQ